MGGWRTQEEAEAWVTEQAKAAGCDVLDVAMAAKLGELDRQETDQAPSPLANAIPTPGACELKSTCAARQTPRTLWRGASCSTTQWLTRTWPTRRRASTSAATRWGSSPLPSTSMSTKSSSGGREAAYADTSRVLAGSVN